MFTKYLLGFKLTDQRSPLCLHFNQKMEFKLYQPLNNQHLDHLQTAAYSIVLVLDHQLIYFILSPALLLPFSINIQVTVV